MTIVYALVARGKTVLAEYTNTSVTGNFPTVTRVLLSKIPSNDSRMSYVYDAYIFHYVVSGGITYLCMSSENKQGNHRVAFSFLAEVEKEFVSLFGSQMLTAIAFSMNDEFSPVLQQLQDKFNTSGPSDNLATVKGQIEDVRNVMVNNISLVLNRGEKIELLVDKTDRLNQQAFRFEKQSRKLKNTMYWKKVKMYLTMAFILGLFITVMCMVGCGGITFPECQKK